MVGVIRLGPSHAQAVYTMLITCLIMLFASPSGMILRAFSRLMCLWMPWSKESSARLAYAITACSIMCCRSKAQKCCESSGMEDDCRWVYHDVLLSFDWALQIRFQQFCHQLLPVLLMISLGMLQVLEDFSNVAQSAFHTLQAATCYSASNRI